MRISDWSSDVCSSDIGPARPACRLLCVTGGDRHHALAQRLVAALAPLGRQGVADAPRRAEDGPNQAIEQRGSGRKKQHRQHQEAGRALELVAEPRSEEHTSEHKSLMYNPYAVLC